jgi:hypothetical protein
MHYALVQNGILVCWENEIVEDGMIVDNLL